MTLAARTDALLDSGDELLGPVLRDAAPIRSLAAEMRHLPGVRPAACIALALPGEDVGIEATALISGDDADTRAGLLASLLAGDRLSPSVKAAARASSPMAALVMLRLANGRLLSALGS